MIDGDTFYLGRQSIRIADIDTPETRGARCAYEATLGDRATHRLHALLNAGPFQLQAGARDADRYGRKLRTVMRDGRSLGERPGDGRISAAVDRATPALVLAREARLAGEPSWSDATGTAPKAQPSRLDRLAGVLDRLARGLEIVTGILLDAFPGVCRRRRARASPGSA